MESLSGVNMKKTIIKTAVITFAALIVACVTVFLIVSAVSPKTIGKIYYNLGMKSSAVRQYELQYENKGHAFSDLVDLTDIAISVGDEEKIARYGKTLAVDFKSKLKELSQREENSYGRNLYDFYATRTVEAAYRSAAPEELGECVKIAVQTTEKYDSDSSLKFVVNLSVGNKDKNLAVCVYALFTKGEMNNISEGKEELAADMQKLDDTFGILQQSNNY